MNRASRDQLTLFLLDYIEANGTTHGMIGAAAVRFGCGRTAILTRMSLLDAAQFPEGFEDDGFENQDPETGSVGPDNV